MIDCYKAELHSVINIGGKNMKLKIDTRHRADPGPACKLQWDKENRELLITWNGETAHMPEPAVNGYFPVEGNEQHSGKAATLNAHPTQVAGAAIRAQVTTPQAHVFAGPGAGKTK